MIKTVQLETQCRKIMMDFLIFSGQILKKPIITLQAVRLKLNSHIQTSSCVSLILIMQLTKIIFSYSAIFIEKKIAENRLWEKVNFLWAKKIFIRSRVMNHDLRCQSPSPGRARHWQGIRAGTAAAALPVPPTGRQEEPREPHLHAVSLRLPRAAQQSQSRRQKNCSGPYGLVTAWTRRRGGRGRLPALPVACAVSE